MSLTTAGGLLNAAGWMATIAGSVALYRSLAGRANLYLWILVLFLATSGLLVELANSVLSESLFYATGLWFLILVEPYCRRPSVPLLLGLLALGAYAFGLRYPGIALIGAGSLRVLQQSSWVWRARLIRGIAIGLSALPVLVWYLAVSGDDAGLPGGHGDRTDGRGVGDVWNSVAGLGSWFVGGIPFSQDEEIIGALADPVLRVATFTAGALITGVLACLLWRWLVDGQAVGPDSPGAIDRLRSAGLLTIANFVVLYAALVTVYRLALGFYVLARYWGPIAIVLVVVGLALASRRGTDLSKPGVRLLVLSFSAVVAANLLVSVSLVYV